MSAAYYRIPEAGATYASVNGQSNPSGFSTMSGGGQAFRAIQQKAVAWNFRG
jgi:hypothetical protein